MPFEWLGDRDRAIALWLSVSSLASLDGPERDATQTLLTISTDDGVSGYAFNVANETAIEGIVRRFPAVDEFQIEVFRDGALEEVRVLVEVEDASTTVAVSEAFRVDLTDRVYG